MYPTVKQVRDLGITIAIDDRMDRGKRSGWTTYPDEKVTGFAWRDKSLTPTYKDDVIVELRCSDRRFIEVKSGLVDWKKGECRGDAFSHYRPALSNWGFVLCPREMLTEDQKFRLQNSPVGSAI